MKKNGFTLIELLAILVILAIIAVITVPIISKVLKESKENTAKDSAYGYVSAVNRLYYSKSLVDNRADVDDGIYTVSELKNMGVSISGREPSEGWCELANGEVLSYSLKIGDYVITKFGERDATVEKSDTLAVATSVSNFIDSLTGAVKSDGAKYVSAGYEVYFNPMTGSKCQSTESGCMHWYLYSVKGDYANMILDHNISTSGSPLWASSEDYTDLMAASVGITYPNVQSFPSYDSTNGSNARGPVTALNYLKIGTSSWVTNVPKVPNSTDKNENIILSSVNDNKYKIDYTGYHARLITNEEAGYLGCTGDDNTCPEWMSAGTSGEDSVAYSGIYGYWTSSVTSNSNNYAWAINSERFVCGNFVVNSNNGVRPVVNVLISDIL